MELLLLLSSSLASAAVVAVCKSFWVEIVWMDPVEAESGSCCSTIVAIVMLELSDWVWVEV